MKIYLISWQDHHSVAGWQDLKDVAPELMINTSVGFLVNRDKNHITLAQTLVPAGELCGDVISILTKNIISKRELK